MLLSESPRWLITRGRKDDALSKLNRLRPKRLVDNGSTDAEVFAIDHAIQASDARDHQGAWLDLFRGTYLRRTIIAALLFWVRVIPRFLSSPHKNYLISTNSFSSRPEHSSSTLTARHSLDRLDTAPVPLPMGSSPRLSAS